MCIEIYAWMKANMYICKCIDTICTFIHQNLSAMLNWFIRLHQEKVCNHEKTNMAAISNSMKFLDCIVIILKYKLFEKNYEP